jgi:aromatic ring-opening dioxygenase catalytic subunit (LigB family)
MTNTVLETLKAAGMKSRATPVTEARGMDGRGYAGPGLDHGVFVPFKLMFGDEFLSVPIVQVTIEGSLKPEANYALGKAVSKLRYVVSSSPYPFVSCVHKIRGIPYPFRRLDTA